MIINQVAYARAALVGNPSDGYHGKTISIILKNLAARCTLYESPHLEIVPGPEDQPRFANVAELRQNIGRFGYYGGVRLAKATVKKFVDYCQEHGIKLEPKNCIISYSSDIPRQVGLGGSSAIVTATFFALMEFYGVSIPKPIIPNLILSVETDELKISAGLQDRVIQVYGGVVYMDFAREVMERQSYGLYEPLEPSLLPPLFVAYQRDLSEGSEVFHDNVRARYNSGEEKVVRAMDTCASLAAEVKAMLVAREGHMIGPLMDRNFEARASIYRLNPGHVRMVEIARELGEHANFAGSGGAVIGTYSDERNYARLEKAYREFGCETFKPVIV